MKRTKVLYLDVADKIKADIFSGKYPVGTMLPTESELEDLFQVSKITVRKAIELLATDEYVEKKSGKGTTVLSNRPYNRLSKAASFTQVLKKSDLTVSKETLKLATITIENNQLLYESFGKRAVRFERLYYLNDKPYIYFVHYLPQEMEKFSKKELDHESLYRLLNQLERTIEKFEDEFSAVFLSEVEQKILKTDEKIAMKRIRKSLDERGKLVEYSEAIYNTNTHPYHIEYET
ncbi:GntR family transcriptional regulator [Enterococcus sp. LJL99]